jgi:hypothetical protein
MYMEFGRRESESATTLESLRVGKREDCGNTEDSGVIIREMSAKGTM